MKKLILRFILQFAEVATATTETAFEGSTDKRENLSQRCGAKRSRGKRGGRGKPHNQSPATPLSDVANITPLPHSNRTVAKVQ